MNKVKLRLISIISLTALFFAVLALAIGALFPSQKVSAAATPASIFWARTGGNVRAYKASEDSEDAWVTFVIADEGAVEYHRNLALKWYESAGENAESDRANPGVAKYLTMTFAFPSVAFEKYTISFQSAEENVSKKGQAVNDVVFEYKDSTLTAYIKNASVKEEEDEEYVPTEVLNIADATADITLAWSEQSLEGVAAEAGEFYVTLNGEALGKFTNVGGYFMEYRTSGTANTPMTFTVDLPEGSEVSSQKIFMKSLNGQKMKVTGSDMVETAEEDGTVLVEGGKVEDDTPAVLVINEKLYAFTLGQRFSLSYEMIDVISDTVTPQRSYYMLKSDEDGYITPDEQPDNANQDYKSLTTSTYFMPTDDNHDEIVYVSIRFVLLDGRTSASREFVYLSWYADDNAVETLPGHTTVKEGEEAETVEWDYIKVDRDRKGPYYYEFGPNESDAENVPGTGYDEAIAKYQESLTALAEDKETSAGKGAYFYLPSLRGLIGSDDADYRNLRFSIYYYKPGQVMGAEAASVTTLRYNNLRIQIDAEGLYRIRILATDASGNAMKAYVDGELTDVTGKNIWEIEKYPEFSFRIKYNGAVIEDAGEQAQGYRGSQYNVNSFDIIALGDCDEEYSLFYFDESKLDGKELPAYSTLVSDIKDYIEGEAYKSCFDEIGKFNTEISEADWDDLYPDNRYHWNPDSSLSFVPQRSGFYVVKVLLTDPNRANEQKTAYQVIEVGNPMDYIVATPNWFQNNITSVILFAISGALAIAIVVLFVVKPSDKKVEEVDLEKLKGKKKSK